MIRSALLSLSLLGVFILGAIAYTWPGPLGIWEMRTDLFMSDGTDLTTNPFQFDMLHRGYLENPSLFFYGGYPNQRLDAPEGLVSWYSTGEKIAGALFPYFVPVEQVSVLLALILLVANGLAFYGMGRAFGWNRALVLALSIAWAFSSFTRARAQVHAGLVGIYPIPLAIWGFLILQQGRSYKEVIKSSLCFLGCATSAHYYLIFLTMFSPFLLLFYLLPKKVHENLYRSIFLLATALFPATLFLALSLTKPAPSEFLRQTSSVLPTTGVSDVWPHPFLSIYSANIEDYFSGDIAIGTKDLNPLRATITNNIRRDMKVGNFHEHALGIRWVIWLAFFLSILFFLKRLSIFRKHQDYAFPILFLLFGIFALLTSLPPDWGTVWGPSAWIHRAVEQIRVPNRAGIFVHFCILVIIGIIGQKWYTSSSLSLRIRQALLWILPVLVVLDFPPFLNPMPIAPIVPSLAPAFSQKGISCGMGYHFPHISANFDVMRFYYLLQSLRGTECSVLNPASTNVRDQKLAQLYGYQNIDLMNKVLQNDPNTKEHLVRFAQCNMLSWLAFDERVPTSFISSVCQEWGGHLITPLVCHRDSPLQKVPKGLPDNCLMRL